MKLLKTIAVIFILIVAANRILPALFGTDATLDAERSLTNAATLSESEAGDEAIDYYDAPIVPSKIAFEDAINRHNSWPVHLTAYVFIGGHVGETESYYISMENYAYSTWLYGVIGDDILKKIGKGEDDEFEALLTLSGPTNIVTAFEDKYFFRVSDLLLVSEREGSSWSPTVIDLSVGDTQFDHCEAAAARYRERGKMGLELYSCTQLTGSDEDWGCVERGLLTMRDFEEAVLGCGLDDTTDQTGAMCQAIIEQYWDNNSGELEMDSCNGLNGYVKNWECVANHYHGGENFVSVLQRCRIPGLEDW